MKILVLGAGATGGYFGGRLAQAGADVTFLVRERRAAQLAANGLVVQSPHGDFTLRPQLATAEQLSGSYDVILLAVKAFSLDSALADMTPAVGSETMILPVLNGMKHVDILAERFGNGTVVGCVITGRTATEVQATAPPDGNIAPPGWYLLFVVDTDRAPSTGAWIRLT